MEKFGFDLNGDILPSFDKFQSSINQRVLFFNLFNQEVSCELKFSKDEIDEYKKENLFNIFAKKILKNLEKDFYLSSSLVSVDIEKTRKINSFLKKLNGSNFKFQKVSLKTDLSEKSIDVALKLIDILEDKDFSFFLDGNKIFKNFVSNKIIKRNENKEITVHKDSIDIKSQEHLFSTKIFTFWEFINSKDLKIDTHIKKAVECIETTEFKQVYLVYPKNENFDKHIQINCDEQINCKDYAIKLIPYSMRSTLR